MAAGEPRGSAGREECGAASPPLLTLPLSMMRDGWLHNFLSDVIDARTRVCLPPLSRVFAVFDERNSLYMASCTFDIEQQTTQTSFGGRWSESSVLVRRRMNWLTS